MNDNENVWESNALDIKTDSQVHRGTEAGAKITATVWELMKDGKREAKESTLQ